MNTRARTAARRALRLLLVFALSFGAAKAAGWLARLLLVAARSLGLLPPRRPHSSLGAPPPPSTHGLTDSSDTAEAPPAAVASPPPPSPDAPVWSDPTLPLRLGLRGTFAELLSSCTGGAELWERWLDGLGLPAGSPSRQHLRHTARSDALRASLAAAFEALAHGKPYLGVAELSSFSARLRGTVRPLLASGSKAKAAAARPLLLPEPAEASFLVDAFPKLFPDDTSRLDLRAFTELAKLLIVRRVVRTLLAERGLQSLRSTVRQRNFFIISFISPPIFPLFISIPCFTRRVWHYPQGLTEPLVVDVTLDHARLAHTVAPPTKAHEGGALLES